jgi:flavin-dependent dehydrogenase
MARFLGERAIVLGGSIAGLSAARVLTDHFRQVVVLERDPLPDQPAARKGTPHARHTHGLLSQGLARFEAMFPGIGAELAALGAEQGDLVKDCLWHAASGFHRQIASGLFASAQSRALLEWLVRERVGSIPNITLRGEIGVQRLLADGRKGITGVQFADRRSEAGRLAAGAEFKSDRTEALSADLVIDATGRGSRLPQWLAELRLPRPKEERVHIDLAYATRLFRRRPGDLGGNMAIVITQQPPNKRFAAMVQMEGGLWSLTMGGVLGDHPQLTDAGLREFAAGMPTPELADFLRTAEPASDILSYKYASSLRRRYERVRHFPRGILPLGDSICSFNPVYGQGMTVAALEAEALDLCLRGGLAGLAGRYFRRVARLVDTPWQIAVGSDYRNPGVPGRRPLGTDLVNRWIDRVHRAAQHDTHVTLAFHRVANLLAPPASLFHPGVALRVLWPQGKSATRAEPPASPMCSTMAWDSTWR